jgi:ketosteroid isomerase-like protein
MSSTLIHMLQDRQAIEECVSRYAHAVDRHDEALIANVYHPDARDTHGPFIGGIPDFAAWVNALHERKTRAHTHNITTHWCELRGDRAFADTYVIFVLYRREREIVMMGSGRYVDRLERRGGAWKIAERRTIIDIRLEADAQRPGESPGGYPVGTWDRSDVSYERPLRLPSQLAALAPHSEVPIAPAVGNEVDAATLLSKCTARRAVKDCITQSVRGLDRGDRELALLQYWPGAVLDDGAFHGDAARHIGMLIERSEEEDLAMVHHLSSHLAEVHEGTATAETYLTLMRHSRDGKRVWVGGLRLLDRLEARQDDWRITSRRIVADYEFEADGSSLLTDDQYLRSRRDREDISYERV